MKKLEKETTSSIFKIITFTILMCLCMNTSAQTNSDMISIPTKNNVYFDTGIFPGAHVFMNYERKVHESDNISFMVE